MDRAEPRLGLPQGRQEVVRSTQMGRRGPRGRGAACGRGGSSTRIRRPRTARELPALHLICQQSHCLVTQGPWSLSFGLHGPLFLSTGHCPHCPQSNESQRTATTLMARAYAIFTCGRPCVFADAERCPAGYYHCSSVNYLRVVWLDCMLSTVHA